MCKENLIHLVSPKILNQIDSDRDSLIEDPRFNLVIRSRICSFLKTNANRHSVNIEFPNTKNGKKKRALEDLTIAREYLSKEFMGELNEEQIKDVAALINGFDFRIPYRNIQARTPERQGHILIYPENVPNEMYRFLNANLRLKHPLEKAIHSHFHLSRIHPFDDGNGRLARLFQNFILEYHKYPPIIIFPEQRQQYLDLLSAAAREYREEGGSLKIRQVRFYTYLCYMLSSTFRDIQIKIKKNKI